MTKNDGRSPADAGSGCQPSALAVPASQSGIPNAWTPGPWQNGIGSREGIVSTAPLSAVGDGNVVCLPPDFRMTASYARWPDNARLIAAAPDLLAAVMAAKDLCDNLNEFGECTDDIYFVRAADLAEQALARASGIEAATADETALAGSAVGESPVREAETPK